MSEIDLQIGELMLFLIGIGLSLVLLFVLLIPFLSRFRVCTWMRINKPVEQAFWQSLIYKMERAGFQVTHQETSIIFAKQVSQYELHFHSDTQFQLTQKGLDLTNNQKLTIISGTGVSWLAMEIHKALSQSGYKPQWQENKEASQSFEYPLHAKQRWMITVSPWH